MVKPKWIKLKTELKDVWYSNVSIIEGCGFEITLETNPPASEASRGIYQKWA
jgi:hypothetical protein